jgi:hypothetical protein
MEDLSALGEAIAAMRGAPPEQRAQFWNGIRDMVDDEIHRESPEPRSIATTPTTASLVYYVRIGDHVKIGTTTNLTARLNALQVDRIPGALLGTEEGGRDVERMRHRQFEADRIDSRRELFIPSSRLMAHIKTLAHA